MIRVTIRLKRTTWALIFAFLSLFLLGIADNIRGPLFKEIISDFNLTNTMGSMMFAITSFMAFIGSIGSSFYLKKYTLSSLLLLGVGCMTAGLTTIGYSDRFQILLIGSLLLGFGIGFMAVSQNLLVSENAPEKYRTRALSGLHSMYALASLLAPSLVTYQMERTGQWGSVFKTGGLLAFSFLVLQVLIRPQPQFEIKSDKIKTDNTVIKKNSKPTKWGLVSMGGLFGFYVVAEILVSTRLPLYMSTYHNYNLVQSSNALMWFFIFLFVGRLLFSLIRFNFDLKILLNAFLGLSLMSLILGLNVNPKFLILTGLFMAPFYPLSVMYISQNTSELSRTYLSFAMSFQSLAVVAMHLGVGYLTDQFGLFYAFGVGIFALVLSLVCLNFHPKKLQQA